MNQTSFLKDQFLNKEVLQVYPIKNIIQRFKLSTLHSQKLLKCSETLLYGKYALV